MKIGFIGLGNLGAPIAANLLEAGHALVVYNRTASRMEPLVAKGAIAADCVADLATQCTVVFSIVSDDAAIRELVEGQDGLLHHFAAGSVHVSLSTILPQTASRLASAHQAEGQEYLASPVFGRPEAATARRLHFVISGKESLRTRITPLLKDAGALGVWEFGDSIEAANTVKLCGNFLAASALEAIGESISLATGNGVDPQAMWSMFSQTLYNTPLYHSYSQLILRQQFEPAAFTMRLGLKDLNLVLELASQANESMPLAVLLRSRMQRMVDLGRGEMDWSAISLADSH
jgi:3-hydroxyisobutyrate dehydrogenase-like beta-hydroxyacid dehydrogenase